MLLFIGLGFFDEYDSFVTNISGYAYFRSYFDLWNDPRFCRTFSGTLLSPCCRWGNKGWKRQSDSSETKHLVKGREDIWIQNPSESQDLLCCLGEPTTCHRKYRFITIYEYHILCNFRLIILPFFFFAVLQFSFNLCNEIHLSRAWSDRDSQRFYEKATLVLLLDQNSLE